jgi:acyl carrier protein
MAIEDTIKEIIVDQLGVEPDAVKPEASFINDLGADSLDTVELVMVLEDEFNIGEVPDEETEKLKTVGDVINCVKTRMLH